MAFKSLATSGIVNFNKYQNALVGNAAYNPPAYEQIATTTLGSNSSADIVFSSVPSTYKHLQVRATLAKNSGFFGNMYLQFNSDSGSNYRYHFLQGTGSSVTSSASGAAGTEIDAMIIAGNNTTGAFSASILDILDYASSSKNTTVRTLTGVHHTSGTNIQLKSGLWLSTAAVNNIRFLTYGETLLAGSRISLYGIKG
jgi:hypothetical protein